MDTASEARAVYFASQLEVGNKVVSRGLFSYGRVPFTTTPCVSVTFSRHRNNQITVKLNILQLRFYKLQIKPSKDGRQDDVDFSHCQA